MIRFIIIVATLAAGPVRARVPPECAPLFFTAGENVRRIVAAGNTTSGVAQSGLDSNERNRYEQLADHVARLLGEITFGFEALRTVIDRLAEYPEGA